MSQDATSEEDLRGTGMPLEHDREWDYELEQVIEVIEEYDAKRVGLQFPEGLKRRGPAVADDLRQLCDSDVAFMLLGQPCYGARDLSTYLMCRTDVFVHLGHLPMEKSDETIYIPLFFSVDPFPIVGGALDGIEGDRVDFITTAQRMNRFEDMCDQLKERDYTVQARKGDDRLAYEGQVLGCNHAPADVPADDVPYVDGSKFHPFGFAMGYPDENVVITDPVNNVVTIADTRKLMKRRYASVHRAMDAEKWGVILCMKIGQGCMGIIKRILEDNENAYLITVDEVTPDRLRDFNMDAFVNTGCLCITTDDGPRFHKPMLIPQEYHIAIGDEPFDIPKFDTFHGAW